jgi:hypothetical protein
MLGPITLLLILHVQSSDSIQAIPNFSGKWVGIPGRGTLPSMPTGPGVTITQDAEVFSVQIGTGPVHKFTLDGESTRHEDKDPDGTHLVTARAVWSGTALTTTEERQGWKQVRVYFFDSGVQGELSVTTSTTLLSSRGGKLTVSTIGPWTRVYRKGPVK